MLSVLQIVTGLFYQQTCTIDNTTFQLHSKLTVAILLFSGFMQSLTQFFGKPIECYLNSKVDKSIFETYCWMKGTSTENERKETIQHTWYQWVIFALFFQGLVCYIPYLLWKHLEGEKMLRLIQDIPRLCTDVDTENIRYKRFEKQLYC